MAVRVYKRYLRSGDTICTINDEIHKVLFVDKRNKEVTVPNPHGQFSDYEYISFKDIWGAMTPSGKV